MKVFWITLLAIIMITATENIQPLNHAIIKSLIMFRMSNPSIMHSSLPKVGQIQLIKHFSNYGQEIIFDPIKYNLHDFLVIFTELEDYEHNKYPETQVPILVITSIEDENNLKGAASNIQFDKEIYFLDRNSFKIYEAYTVSKIDIIRYLGQFDENATIFNPAKNFGNSLIERRGDLYGMELKCMVQDYPPMIKIPVSSDSQVPFYSNNQTYDLTTRATGVYVNVLQSLEKIHNFSTKFYQRKDGKWGSGILANGTKGAEGMLMNLVEGSADMATPLTMSISRIEFIDFGPPISVEFLGLYIPRHNKWEDIDWIGFMMPFTWNLWVTIFAAASLFSMCVYIMEWLHFNNRPTIVSLFDMFCTSLMANLGGASFGSKVNNFISYKGLIFISSISGLIISTAYSASLVSELSVKVIKFPFDDPESLSKTEYTLYMGQRSGRASTIIMNAKVYENLRKNNIDQDTSFNSIRESIKKTLDMPKSALLYPKLVIDNQAEYECKLRAVWTMSSPWGYETFGLRKNSPLKKFFRKSIRSMTENGVLDLFFRQNSLPSTQCDEIKTSVEILGWYQTAPLFFIFLMGVIISFSIVLYEFFHKPQKVESITEEKTKYFEQSTRSFHSLLRSTMNSYENDESNYNIFHRYFAETEIFLDQLNKVGTNSEENIGTE